MPNGTNVSTTPAVGQNSGKKEPGGVAIATPNQISVAPPGTLAVNGVGVGGAPSGSGAGAGIAIGGSGGRGGVGIGLGGVSSGSGSSAGGTGIGLGGNSLFGQSSSLPSLTVAPLSNLNSASAASSPSSATSSFNSTSLADSLNNLQTDISNLPQASSTGGYMSLQKSFDTAKNKLNSRG